MPWTPPSASGLQLWLKADSMGMADNAAVSLWADSSGNSNWAVQSTVPNQPKFRTNIINGLPVVRFDGSASYMTTSLSAANKPVTIAAVVKTTSLAGVNTIVSSSAAGGSVFRLETSGVQGLIKDYVVAIASSSTSVGTTAFHVVRVTYDGSGNYAFYLDGVADGTGLNNQTFSATTRVIGVDYPASSAFLSGDLAEYVEYNTALSTADGAALDNYLYQKWLSVAYFATLAATSTTVPRVQKAAGKGLVATSTTIATMRKAASKGLATVTLTVPALAKSAGRYVVLAATSTTVPRVQKTIGKNVSVVSSSAANISKGIIKTLATASLTVPSLRKAIAKTLSAVSLSAPTLATAKNAIVIIHLALGKLVSRAGTGAIKTRSGLGWLISRSGLGNLRSK